METQVRRGDGEAMDKALMGAIWRGLIFNMFYSEKEATKLAKLAEEDWDSVNPKKGLGACASPPHKRKYEVEQIGDTP